MPLIVASSDLFFLTACICQWSSFYEEYFSYDSYSLLELISLTVIPLEFVSRTFTLEKFSRFELVSRVLVDNHFPGTFL